jgi:hypothetical protein
MDSTIMTIGAAVVGILVIFVEYRYLRKKRQR